MMKFEKLLSLIAIGSMALATACGGGSSSSTTTSSGGSGSTGGGGSTTNNTAQLIVDEGPPAAVAAGLVADNNLAFATINVCVPGTSTCQTIDHVQVDTGSSGLRMPAGVLTVALQQQTNFECLLFGDGTNIWGPLATADIQIAGEVAHNVPIQLASNAVPPASASSAGCSGASQIVSVADFGANGILGLGVFRYDCGQGGQPCLNLNLTNYFGPNCATGTCNPIAQSPANQVQNPVPLFASDNNGVILQLPPISANGQPTANGSLIFGIGTQSDNSVGSATAIIPDPGTGEFAANFKGVLYNDVTASGSGGTGGAAFIDSGSNGLFFLDSATLENQFGISMPDCPTSGSEGLPGFYCPGGLTTIAGGSAGLTIFSESSQDIPIGAGKPVTLNVQNGQSLIFSPNSAFDDLGGENSNTFDLGLPFFFGQTVFFGIEGQSTPLGTGPLYAF